MSKAEATRAKIIEQAASLFNQQGFAGVSMTNLMAATGLKKGGIYNHFASKEELAIVAFDYAVEKLQQRYRPLLRQQQHSIDRLLAMLAICYDTINDPPVQGGCPLMNTAIVSDDTHPVLRSRARQGMEQWQSLIRTIVDRGIAKGEIRPSVDASVVASVLIATLEGAIMLTKLYDDPRHFERVQVHLKQYVEQLRQTANE